MLRALRNRFLAALAAAGLLTLGASAQTTYTWNLNNTGNWDTSTANWTTGGAPAAWANVVGNTAVFGDVITTSRTVTLTTPITAGILNFSVGGTPTYTLSGSTLTLSNGASNAQINVAGGYIGTATYSGTGGHTYSGGTLNWTNNLTITNNGAVGTTNLTLAGTLTGPGGIFVLGQGNTTISGTLTSAVTGGIAKLGSGTLNLTGTNAFTGSLGVTGGVLSAGSDAALGGAANSINLNGGTFRAAASLTLGSGRVVNMNGDGGIDIISASTLTLGTAGQLAGSGALLVSTTNGTTGALAITTGSQPYTGALTIGTPAAQLVGSVLSQRVIGGPGTTLTLGGTTAGNTGAIAASSIILSNNAALVITNPTTVTTGRIGAVPITSNGGNFRYNTNANGGTGVVETFGSLTATGYTVFNGSNTAGPATGTTLNFGTLTLTDGATVLFQGPQSGTQGTFGGAVATTSVRYFFSGLTADNVTSGTTRSVIPWAGNSISLGSTFPQNFMTYDANGFRPLNTTTEVVSLSTANTLAAAAAGVNIRTTTSGLTQTVKVGGQAINSYSAANAQTIAGTATAGAPGDILTVTSGAWAQNGTITTTNVSFNFPNGAYFHNGDQFNLSGNSRFLGAGGLTVSGVSTSYSIAMTNTPTGGNTFTGGVFLNGAGRIGFTLNNQLGMNNAATLYSGGITLGGGQLIYTPGAAATVSLSDGVETRAIKVTASNGTVGTSIAGAVLQIPGAISGPGQMQFGGGVANNATGVVELTNAAANTYTGGTLVSTGILRISNVNQLGTGAVLLNGGTLQTAAATAITFANPLTVVASSTLGTQDGSITLAGGLNGSGGTAGTSATSMAVTRTGSLTAPSTLTISGPGNFAGTILSGSGAVVFNGAGKLPELTAISLIPSGTPTGGAAGSLSIDNSVTNLADRTGRATNLTLSNGSLAGASPTVTLTTNAAGSTFRFGSLTVTGGSVTNPNNTAFNVTDGGSGNNTIRFTSLTIAASSFWNILGSANLGLPSAGGSRIFFDTAPTLTGGAIAGVTFTGSDGSGGLISNSQATYDPLLGVIALLSTSGTLIDNTIATPTKAFSFTTNGPTTANLGASIKNLTVAGHTVTLVNAGYTPAAINDNAPADTLILSVGGLSSTTGASTITSATATTIRFGVAGAANASIVATTNLTIDPNVTLATTGGLTKTGPGTLTVSGTNSITGPYDISGAGLTTLPSTTAASLANSGNLAVTGTLTLNGASAGSFNHTGVLSGTVNVSTTAGFTNVQTLAGANTFTGSVVLNGGTLVAGNVTALGNAANTIDVNAGATLSFIGNVTIANAYATEISGVGAAGRTGALDNVSGTNTYTGPLTISGSATIGATAGTLVLDGGISGGTPTFNPSAGAFVALNTVALNLGTNPVTKTGGGTLVLPNVANTIGNLNVSGGLVRAGADNNLGVNTNSINLTNGGGLQYGTVFTLDIGRTITVGTGGGAIDTNGLSPTLANPVGGTGGLVKSGGGILTLTGASTYGGNTAVVNGTLAIGVNSALPATTALTLGNTAASDTNGLLTLGGFTQTIAGLTLVAPSGTTTRLTGAGTLTIAGPISYVNNTVDPGNDFPVTIGSGATTVFDLGGGVRTVSVTANANTNDLVIAGVLQNGGLSYTGTGTSTPGLSLTQANTFTGGLTVNSGALNVSGTLGGPTNALTILATGTAGVGTNSIVSVSAAQTIGSLSGGTVSGTAVATYTSTALTTINQASNTAFGGIVAGTGAVTKSGVGTLALNGINTYTGATTVSGGTLRGNGSLTSTVSVASGGTLAGGGLTGTGTLGVNGGLNFVAGAAFGTRIVNAGGNTVSPGDSSGTLTSGVYPNNTLVNKTGGLAPSGLDVMNLSIDLGSLGYDGAYSYVLGAGLGSLNTINGGLLQSAPLTTNPNSGGTVTAGTFTFTNVNPFVLSLDNITLTGNAGGQMFLNFTAVVPEPALLGLVALGAVALVRRRKA